MTAQSPQSPACWPVLIQCIDENVSRCWMIHSDTLAGLIPSGTSCGWNRKITVFFWLCWWYHSRIAYRLNSVVITVFGFCSSERFRLLQLSIYIYRFISSYPAGMPLVAMTTHNDFGRTPRWTKTTLEVTPNGVLRQTVDSAEEFGRSERGRLPQPPWVRGPGGPGVDGLEWHCGTVEGL